MTQNEKDILFKDLCARLPYGALVFIRKPFGCIMSENKEEELAATTLQEFIENDDMHVFPYLRPMTSMTEEEEYYYFGSIDEMDGYKQTFTVIYQDKALELLDWLNAHHFDYRNLIGKGLALRAPEGMYKTE